MARFRFVHPLLTAQDFQNRPELDRLCDWWRNGGPGVCALVGIGGAGKTAIAERFLQLLPGVLPRNPRLEKDSSLEPPSSGLVFSFYDAPHADAFFNELYVWLAILAREEIGSEDVSVSYSRTLQRLEHMLHGSPGQDAQILLILDGLEKVQSDDPAKDTFGQIIDNRLRDFVMRVASGYLGRLSLLITSRFRLLDPEAYRCPHYWPIPIERLDAAAAVSLLRARGVRHGTQNDLLRLAKAQGFHALTIDLMGGYVAQFCRGNPSLLPEDHSALEDSGDDSFDPETRALRLQGKRFARVAARYQEALAETDPAALSILQRICLFRLGVNERDLAEIFLGNDKVGVSGPQLAALTPGALRVKLRLLVEMRLLERVASKGGKSHAVYNIHPAVRDGFFRGLDDVVARQGHNAARKELEAKLGARPGRQVFPDEATLDLLEEIIYHTIQAGAPKEAWQVYVSRIHGFEYLGWRLGAYERGERICRAFVVDCLEDPPVPLELDAHGQMHFLNERALYLERLGSLAKASRCFSRLKEMRLSRQDYAGGVLAMRNIGSIQQVSGRIRDGIVSCKEAIVASEKVPVKAERYWQLCSSLAALAHGYVLRGEVEKASSLFDDAIRAQQQINKGADFLVSNRGLLYAFFLLRTGRLDEALWLAKTNKKILQSRYGPGDDQVPSFDLVLSEIAWRRGSFDRAHQILERVYDWAVEKDAKEQLCCVATLHGRIATTSTSYAGEERESFLNRAVARVDEGLRIAEVCGYSLFYVELCNVRGCLSLLLGDGEDCEAWSLTALYGSRNNSLITPPEERGIFPPDSSGLPSLYAATHPTCGYAWGEAEARFLLAESLLLRAATDLDRNTFTLSELAKMPYQQGDLVRRAQVELEASSDLWQSIGGHGEPPSAATQRRLSDGILTEYSLGSTVSEADPRMNSHPQRSVFISYSHSDRGWLERLECMLSPLVRNGTVVAWADTSIQPGEEWRREIRSALAVAGVAVLLVSDNFLASEFIVEWEMPALVEAAESRGLKILWIYIRPCLYEETIINSYQAAHDISCALEELDQASQDRLLRDICKRIKQALG